MSSRRACAARRVPSRRSRTHSSRSSKGRRHERRAHAGARLVAATRRDHDQGGQAGHARPIQLDHRGGAAAHLPVPVRLRDFARHHGRQDRHGARGRRPRRARLCRCAHHDRTGAGAGRRRGTEPRQLRARLRGRALERLPRGAQPRAGRRARRSGQRRGALLVQRQRGEPLVPDPRLDDGDHDAARDAAHLAGDRARVRGGHAGGAVRDAVHPRPDPDRQAPAVFPAGDGVDAGVRADGAAAVQAAAARLVPGARPGVGGVPGAGAGAGPADIGDHENADGRGAARAHDRLHARDDAVGFSVRYPLHAAVAAGDHAGDPGALHERVAADGVPGRRSVVGAHSQHAVHARRGGAVLRPHLAALAQAGGLKELEPMLQRLSAIVRKELITMLRDPRARLSLIIPPIIQLFVFSSAATMAAEGAPLSGAPPQARTGGAGPAPPPNAEVVIDNWFNPNLEYQWFMMPNLVGMLSLAVALMITALSVARERELGTFDQTLVSPATPIEIALGKLLPPLLVASVQATLYLLIVTLLYGVPFRGNLLVFYAAILTFAAACAGVGLFISSLVHTQQQAFLGAFAVLLPFALLSGFATPVENMPWWLQFVTTINPLAHMLRLMQGLFLKGASVASMAQDLVKLLEIALCTTAAAVLLFRRKAA